jgi:hypothetical protein
MLIAALSAAALVVGLTGTWSPCGFSMVDTLGPTGHTGGRRTTIAACAAFLPGALVGGVATFGSLAILGGLVHGAGGTLAYLIAAAIALVAALVEARGVPIVPQIRRQLPEHWRRVMPMPLAAALYGVLLGLGFTTFVLTFGVWALAGISFATGDAAAGLAIGLAFGIGRALPIIVLAPLADRPLGRRATDLMALRPGIYRGFRFGDALALGLAAAALGAAGSASAANTRANHAADPSTDAKDVVWQREGSREGVLGHGGMEMPLPGRDPDIGGDYIATLQTDEIELLDRASLAPVADFEAPGVDAVALSQRWLVYRTRRDERDALHARDISDPANPGQVRDIAGASAPSQIGRPSVAKSRVFYAIASRTRNRIVRRTLTAKHGGVIAASRNAAVSNPAVVGQKLVYLRTDRRRQHLMLKRLGGGGKGHSILTRRRGSGTLWSTAIGTKRAYVTLLHEGDQRILSKRVK